MDVGPGVDVAHGAVLCVEAGEQAVVRAGVDEVRIERVGSDPAAFATAYVVPVTLEMAPSLLRLRMATVELSCCAP